MTAPVSEGLPDCDAGWAGRPRTKRGGAVRRKLECEGVGGERTE